MTSITHKSKKVIAVISRPSVLVNWLAAIVSSNRQKQVVRSRPLTVRIAPANICNYGCLFCEIHKDDAIWPKRSKNVLTVRHVEFFSELFCRARRLDFCGGSAEPLLAKEFGDIVVYLKDKYKLTLGVTTNASTINEKLAETLVAKGFDHLLISYHAGTEKGYKWLMTGDINKVNRNIKRVTTQKKLKGKRYPSLNFNFALHRGNQDEFEAVMDQARRLGVEAIQVSKYYGGFNKLQHLNVGYENDPKAGNNVLDSSYKQAKAKGVRLVPKTPDYWLAEQSTTPWDSEDVDYSIKCRLPWTHVQFNPVLDEPNKIYMGVCNRLNLFKIQFQEATPGALDSFLSIDVWNHPLLQHLRATVNQRENINPICKLCKSRGAAKLRVEDAGLYAGLRDSAVREFLASPIVCGFNHADKRVEVLTENPYDHETHSHALSQFTKQQHEIS
jgi:molybdenum cofactor biosynthesis enzyme MoaA